MNGLIPSYLAIFIDIAVQLCMYVHAEVMASSLVAHLILEFIHHLTTKN